MRPLFLDPKADLLIQAILSSFIVIHRGYSLDLITL
jgi:hypothetical protein